MCGHGRVQVDGDERVVDFYRQLPFPDVGHSDTWHAPSKNLFQLGPSGVQRVTQAEWRVTDQVAIQLQLTWQTRELGRPQGDTLVLEERLYRAAHQGQATVIDVFSRLMPAGRAVTLLPENDHGYLGLRVQAARSGSTGVA